MQKSLHAMKCSKSFTKIYGKEQKRLLSIALYFQILIIAPKFGIFVHVNHHKKLKKYKFVV